MYSTLREVAEVLWIPFCLSMMGFVVRIAKYGVSSWRLFISSLLCSAFAGVLAHWFLAGSGLDIQIVSACIAMSGYCGGALLDAISGRILREVNEIDIPDFRVPHSQSNTDFENNLERKPVNSASDKDSY